MSNSNSVPSLVRISVVSSFPAKWVQLSALTAAAYRSLPQVCICTYLLIVSLSPATKKSVVFTDGLSSVTRGQAAA